MLGCKSYYTIKAGVISILVWENSAFCCYAGTKWQDCVLFDLHHCDILCRHTAFAQHHIADLCHLCGSERLA